MTPASEAPQLDCRSYWFEQALTVVYRLLIARLIADTALCSVRLRSYWMGRAGAAEGTANSSFGNRSRFRSVSRLRSSSGPNTIGVE
jgi:hypothetical protein